MPRKFQYSIDLNLKENHEGYHTLAKMPAIIGYKDMQSAEKSRGAVSAGKSQNNAALIAKRQSKAMALAAKPGQQIMMNAFMMYMSGKNLNLFSISTTSMAILTPITSIFRIESIFGKLECDTQLPRLLYIGLNLVWLAIGLYKMRSMRLLPTTSADFADSIVWKDMMETTSIPPDM